MIIKIALVSDAEAIVLLEQAASSGRMGQFGKYKLKPSMPSLAAIRERFQDHIFLKAVVNDETIVGSIHLHMQKDIPYIGGLVVHPEYVDSGVGEQLILEAEALFKIGQQLDSPISLDEGQGYRKTTFTYKRLIRFQ